MTIAEDLLKYQHKINTRREANLGREDHPKQIILRLLDVNLDESGLPCVDPKSLALFSYMKLCEVTYPTLMFTWECAEGNSRDLPNVYFEDDHETIYSIEHLKTTIYSLEKLRGIPPRSEIQNILRAVGDIEKACFYGLFKCLQPSESPWMSRLITTPEDMLKLQMEDACNYLSDMLEANSYLLDKLYKNKPSPSCLDARLFGAAIVVYKCFGCIGNGNDYFSNVYNALRRHLNLRAYLERLHAQLILSLSYNPINYDANMIQDPSFVTTWFVRKENLFQVQNKTLFKSANNIYAFSCCDANPLHLPRGDYIIKESSDHMRGTFESEINVHRRLLHRSFIRPVGHGWLMARCEDGHNKAKGFIVLPLKKKGSLQSNLEGFL